MKYCPYCGAAQEFSTAAFCAECGTSIAIVPNPTAKPSRKKKKTRPKKEATPVKHRLSDDYDGYYRDTPVADNGQARVGLDPILAKKIVLLAVGVALVIGIAILAMYFL